MAFTGKIGHVEGIESPWGNAGGVVKTVEDVERMAHTGVGWIEAGSYTLEPRIGNSPNGETVYYHNPETGETFNALGMPNKGMDIVEQEIPEMARIAHAHNKPLVVNVAPVSEDPINESRELVARAYEARADAVLLNAGCPNVVTADGGRHEILSHSPAALDMVLRGLRDVVDAHGRIFLRISPNKTYADTTIVRNVLMSDFNHNVVSAVFTPNTWAGNKPLDKNGDPILEVPGGMGGKSGPATARQAEEQTDWAVSAFQMMSGRKLDIVSSGGIVSARELGLRLRLGAVAGAGTTFFYESQNGWADDTNKLLSDLTL